MTITSVAPGFLTLGELSNEERIVYARLRKQLATVAVANARQEAYYEASQVVKHLNIAVPPSMQAVQAVCGWPGTGIDVLNERLSWDNWTSVGDLMGLDDVYRENELEIESDRATLDALLAGVAFMTVGKGDPAQGEPEILVTAESPSDCTMIWDYRARRGTSALSRTVNGVGIVVMETLYLLDETITLERDPISQRMVVTERDHHGFNRLPVSALVNRSRASRKWGRSEITRAVRYLADATIRTLLGMEINREFYTTPQRWLMGADMSMFTDKDGNTVSAFEAVMGHMLAAPRPFDEDTETYGDAPTAGQFAPAPPTPYLEQIRGYALLFSAEVGIPASALGYATDNPASADAIRAGYERLTARSVKRQKGFTPGHRSTAYNILLWRDGKVDLEEFAKVGVKWADASVSTPQAAADEASKLVGSGVLLPDSSVTYDRVGLSSQEQLQIASEKRASRARQTLDQVAAAAAAARQNPVVGDLNARRGDQG